MDISDTHPVSLCARGAHCCSTCSSRTGQDMTFESVAYVQRCCCRFSCMLHDLRTTYLTCELLTTSLSCRRNDTWTQGWRCICPPLGSWGHVYERRPCLLQTKQHPTQNWCALHSPHLQNKEQAVNFGQHCVSVITLRTVDQMIADHWHCKYYLVITTLMTFTVSDIKKVHEVSC